MQVALLVRLCRKPGGQGATRATIHHRKVWITGDALFDKQVMEQICRQNGADQRINPAGQAHGQRAQVKDSAGQGHRR